MPRVKLNKSAIDALPIPAKEIVYWDSGCPGFGVKVTPKGRRVFIVLYRVGGAGARLRKYTIGPYGRVTLHQARVAALRDQSRVVDPGILSPLGVVFGLLIVFTAAQVWADLERANSAVADEASALRDVVLLANSLSEDENSKLRALVRAHILTAEDEEWPAMARGDAVVGMPTSLRRALQEVLAFPTIDDLRKTAIMSALQKSLDARRQRIVISQSTVSGVRWLGLLLTGLCVLSPWFISTISGTVVLHSRSLRRAWRHPY